MKIKKALLIVLAVLLPAISARAGELDTQGVRKGVVRVMAFSDEGVELGTGFVINSSGNIVTNAHVIKPAVASHRIKILTDDMAEKLRPEVEKKFGQQVQQSGGLVSDQIEGQIIDFLADKLPSARIKWYDEKQDLAVLECNADGLLPLSLTASKDVKEGQAAYALGFPGKGDMVGASAFLSLKVYNGAVASKEVNGANGDKVYQITTPTLPGNSGGPLMTECGTVIGITSFHLGEQINGVQVGESLRFAIQIDELIPDLDAQHIPYTLASSCGATGGTNPILLIGMIVAIGLGVAAVALAATNRGRRAVKDVVESVSVRLNRPHRPPTVPEREGVPAGNTSVVLKALAGPHIGESVQLDGTPIALGRDPGFCQIVFPAASTEVSKRHCMLRIDSASGRIILEDLGSTVGTFVQTAVGNERVWPGKPRTLGFNERFWLGSPDNMYEIQSAGQVNQHLGMGGANQGYVMAAAPVLKGLQGEFAGRTLPVDQQGLLFGRDPGSCHVVFPDGTRDVSKRHCSLRFEAATGNFVLEDLGSTNGTFVLSGGRKEQLQPGYPRRLKQGDRFFLGDPHILFEVNMENQ